MNDKKFVHIILFSIFIFVLVTVILIQVMPDNRYLDGEYPYWKQQKDYTNAISDKQEVLLLGDSRMKVDVLAAELGDNVYNLALGGATPLEMYYTMKHYLENHPRPRAVIIAFGPIHFTEMNIYDKRNMYFHYLDKYDNDEANKIIYEQDDKDYRNLSIRYQYKFPTIYMKPVIKSIFLPRNKYNDELYARVAGSKGRMFGHDDKSVSQVIPEEAQQKNFVPLPSLKYFMEQLIELCIRNNIPVYVEQLPMGNPGFQKLIDNGYMDEYQLYMKSLQKKYDINVNCEVPLYDTNLFQDSSHLNLQGAKKITAEWKNKYSSFCN